MQPPTGGQGETVGIATTTVAPTVGAPLSLSAPWPEGGTAGTRSTCDGDNVSPALTWTGGPEDPSAWAVVLTDLDAPAFAHWAVANIDAAARGIPEGFADDLVAVAMNSDAKPAYTGPCPPAGSTHRYTLTVYALSQVLETENGDPAPAMRAAIESAATESASVSFTYSR